MESKAVLLKEYLYSKSEETRKVAMIGLGVGLAVAEGSNKVGVKDKINTMRATLMIDNTSVEQAADKHLAYLNKRDDMGCGYTFETVLGFNQYYTKEDIETINNSYGAFAVGYNYSIACEA